MKPKITLFSGDAKVQLSNLPPNSIDLIFTSPPYAERRKNTYGGISQHEYVDWFLPIADELFEVLRSSGTFRVAGGLEKQSYNVSVFEK
ncbi:MAG: DNA methyltransferase [Pyrinomonadaceae bacterium]